MNIEKQIKDLAARYADCGIDGAVIREMMGRPSDLDARAKLIGVRMCLGMAFNRQEFFTLDDLAHVTGGTKDAVVKQAQAAGISPISISPAPWLKEGRE